MDISVVIPVYNEEENLKPLYRQLRSVMDSLHKSYEIIFVDDGSVDNGFTVLTMIRRKNPHVKIIRFDRNYGKTSAIDAGFRSAQGNLVLTIDADLQYDPSDFLRILKELEHSDVVVGFRCNRKNVDGVIKFMSSKIGNYVRNKILGENFKDVGCFLTGYRKKCLEGLMLYRRFQVFIPSLLNMAGYRIKEIEVKIYPRKHGKSKYNVRNRLFKELLALFIIKWMQKNRLKYRISYDSRF